MSNLFNHRLNNRIGNFANTKVINLKERLNSCIISMNELMNTLKKENKTEEIAYLERVKYTGEQFYFFLDYALQNNLDPTDPKKSKPFENIKEYCEEVDKFLRDFNLI